MAVPFPQVIRRRSRRTRFIQIYNFFSSQLYEMESPQKDAITSTTPFKKPDFSFVEDFNQIIELILTGNNSDAVGKSVAQLEEKFENAKQVLDSLPGLQYTKEEQEALLAEELKVLERKKTQLQSYKQVNWTLRCTLNTHIFIY